MLSPQLFIITIIYIYIYASKFYIFYGGPGAKSLVRRASSPPEAEGFLRLATLIS
jgi:hypothetical protein